MNSDEQQKLTFLTQRGAEIAAMLAQSETKALGVSLAVLLTEEYRKSFPAHEAKLREARQRSKEALTKEGPKLWAELHRRALSGAAASLPEERVWLSGFASRLACGECRQFFVAYLREHPVALETYFDWTVALHNAVNLKLGKPIMTATAAREVWSA